MTIPENDEDRIPLPASAPDRLPVVVPITVGQVLRHWLFIILAGVVIVAVCAIVGLTLAVRTVSSINDNQTDELRCRGVAAAETQQKLSDAIGALSAGAATTLEGLSVVADPETGDLKTVLDDVPSLLESLRSAANSLEGAADAQLDAVDDCAR